MTDFFGLVHSGSRGRVLVVDDEADVRKAVNLALTKSGYDVVEADDGKRAVEVINSDDNALCVDVVICDIRMPRVNGVEAIAYFRREFPTLPVIVLTGFPDVQLATSLLKQGVADYVVKPVERDTLAAAVEAAMKHYSRV
ncbi:MAG TPA: response regulator [Nitrospiria bacterium]|nr:response regulator [Nitrospiria bacterium]